MRGYDVIVDLIDPFYKLNTVESVLVKTVQ